MGFSLVAAFGIISVTIIIAVGIISENILPSVKNLNDSYDQQAKRQLNRLQTNINITEVTVTAYGPNYNHSILLKNAGSITLNTSDFIILINGVPQLFTSSKPYIYPEKQAYFNITNVPGLGAQRLKIITENGISKYYEYII